MLPLSKVKEVRRLLDAGELSQRKIAKLLDVSRGVVGSIASGRRGIYGKEPQIDNFSGLPSEDLKPVRCPDCGGWVFMPCALCRAREFRRRRRLLDEFARMSEKNILRKVA